MLPTDAAARYGWIGVPVAREKSRTDRTDRGEFHHASINLELSFENRSPPRVLTAFLRSVRHPFRAAWKNAYNATMPVEHKTMPNAAHNASHWRFARSDSIAPQAIAPVHRPFAKW
jgi:hypothetical protein